MLHLAYFGVSFVLFSPSADLLLEVLPMSTARQGAQTSQIFSAESTPARKLKRPLRERLIKVAYLDISGHRQEAWMKESNVPLFFHRGIPRID
jgi:hypothetical protein